MSDYYQFRDETGNPIDYYQLVNDNNELCEEIERLNNIIDKKEQFLGDNIKRLEREVVKRDNIINELEKYLEKIIIDGGTRGSMTFWYRQIYDYLQELKGSDSNE